MLAQAKLKMAKTFDQAIYDETANDLYSARNAKFDELEDLIDQSNDLNDQTAYTRSSKGKYINLKSRSNVLITKLRDENEALCTALFKLNPKITDDARYKEDQKAFRGWIKNLENALLDLEVKLEDEAVNPTQPIVETPLPTSDLSSIF